MSEALITSAANPRLKSLLALRRRRSRDELGLALLEGFDEVGLALAAGVRPRELYHCPELAGDVEAHLDLVSRAREAGSATVRLSRIAFEKVAYREGPDGILAVTSSPARPLAEIDLPADALVLVCQGVEKPGNLGAIVRTADAVGAAAVIAADPVTDWANPNIARAAKGTVYTVPVASASTSEVLAWLAEHDVTLIATTPHTTDCYTDVAYTGRVAIAVGAEKYGLDDAMLAAAASRVIIPMAGQVNSLNVATTAALVAYEVVRQRGPKTA